MNCSPHWSGENDAKTAFPLFGSVGQCSHVSPENWSPVGRIFRTDLANERTVSTGGSSQDTPGNSAEVTLRRPPATPTRRAARAPTAAPPAAHRASAPGTALDAGAPAP